MLQSSLFRSFLVASLLLFLMGCSNATPTRSVQFGEGMLDMAISELWELESSTEEGRIYAHRDLGELRLHLDGTVEDIGQPLRVTDVKSIVGKELNHRFGGVSTRVSLGGNAMIKYSRERVDEYDEPVHTEDWVLAKPTGYGDITRVEITLWIPEDLKATSEIALLIEELDKQVGDARIPRA